ncbi:MAG: hypothetical protein RLZZ624_1264 [Cyanobacteriota bacterium]
MVVPCPAARPEAIAPPDVASSPGPGRCAGAVAHRPDQRRPRRVILQLLALLSALMIPLLGLSQPLAAAPVQWKEVTATEDGRQWWDEGSLRINREGYLTVLSRFQPAAPSPDPAPEAGSAVPSAGAPAEQGRVRQPPSTLYVMEIDCDQALYRDRSINGFHQFSPEWQPVMADDLIGEVITQACAAAPLA